MYQYKCVPYFNPNKHFSSLYGVCLKIRRAIINLLCLITPLALLQTLARCQAKHTGMCVCRLKNLISDTILCLTKNIPIGCPLYMFEKRSCYTPV